MHPCVAKPIPMLHGRIPPCALDDWHCIGETIPFYSVDWETTTVFYRNRARTRMLICESTFLYDDNCVMPAPPVLQPYECANDNPELCRMEDPRDCVLPHWRVIDAREFVFMHGSHPRMLCAVNTANITTMYGACQLHIIAVSASMRHRQRERYTDVLVRRRPIVWSISTSLSAICTIPVDLSGAIPANLVCRGFATAPEHLRSTSNLASEIPLIMRKRDAVAIWNTHAHAIVIARARVVYTYGARTFACDGVRLFGIDGDELVEIDSGFARTVRERGRTCAVICARVRICARTRSHMRSRKQVKRWETRLW